MTLFAIVPSAARSLRRAPIRSALTALGVIVGVAAVVATTSIGNGARKQIQDSLEKPESRTIHLMAAPQPSVLGRAVQLPRSDQLRVDDYYAIRSLLPDISAASPRIYLPPTTAHANGKSQDIVVEGIDVDGFKTVPRSLITGALFSSLDVSRATTVCVISESLASKLFPSGGPVGRRMRIDDVAFTVLGVVDDVPNNNSAMFRLRDMRVYAPFTSALRRLDPTAQMTISVQAVDVDAVPAVRQNLDDLIEHRRSGRKAVFRTSAAFEAIRVRADGSVTVARLLAAVGAIALVVGGIGIMNIMMVSVGERTREIGIRMAIGTRGRNILGQFLAEAVVLSVLGGGVGVLIGWGASWFITRLNDWPTQLDLASVAVAVLCSAGVGMFFGWYPARRAAELDPVKALKAE